MNPWETLGVSKGASQEDIKRAWRKKAMRFHPDRGGDAELFKQALFAYEVLCGRWQARSASTDSQSGQGEQRRAGERFEQNEDFPRYAQAYYDAWYSVPDNIRFWFSFFNFLHGVSLIFAFPLFFGGGLLLLAGLLFGKPPEELVIRTFTLVAVSGVLVLAVYTKFWDQLRVDLQDKYSSERARGKEKAATENQGFAQRQSEKTEPNSEPDTKGGIAGCAVVLALLLGLAFFGVLTAPNLKVHPIVGLAIYGAMFGIPLVLLLKFVFKGKEPAAERAEAPPDAKAAPNPAGGGGSGGDGFASGWCIGLTVFGGLAVVLFILHLAALSERAPPGPMGPPAETKAPLIQAADESPKLITNTLGMKLVLVPAGEFLMGSLDSDKDAQDDEKPRHHVRITQSFYLGATEVTVGQFRRVVESARYQTEAEKYGKGGWGWNEAKMDFEQDPKYTWRNPGFARTDDTRW